MELLLSLLNLLFIGSFFLLGIIPIVLVVGGVVLIIYLIAKRVEDKEKEDFEKRDN
jgi:hypothetical protein